jgi:NH3-dependent NAD+ synthetase
LKDKKNGPLNVECERCLLTSTVDSKITLLDGECQHCRAFTVNAPRRITQSGLAAIVDSIKRKGVGHQYDCVVGVSGGVDSSYLLLMVHNLGLRALAIHVDNGWNSNLAVSNIQKIISHTNIDLYTEVLDLKAFNDLQKAFLMASVPDLEIPTDHAIQA